MPNIAAVFKQEISRIARRETRGELEQAKRAVASYRKQLVDLRRRVDALERKVSKASSQRQESTEEGDESGPTFRFRPDGLKKHRERLGLSAAEAGRILGVSQLSVYKWESGKTRPRAKQLASIAQLRTMGKREAAARLQQLSG